VSGIASAVAATPPLALKHCRTVMTIATATTGTAATTTGGSTGAGAYEGRNEVAGDG